MYAVFENGKQVSKAHSTIEAANTEAFEMGAVASSSRYRYLIDEYEIREIKENNDG